MANHWPCQNHSDVSSSDNIGVGETGVPTRFLGSSTENLARLVYAMRVWLSNKAYWCGINGWLAHH